MSDRLEWAHVTSGAELLFPGENIDDAVVEPGEIAVAVWTGSNGIALHGPRDHLRDRLLQLGEDYYGARAAFSWPRPHAFNWALEWFDAELAADEHGSQTALKVIGEKWALLALREITLGQHRFDDIAFFICRTVHFAFIHDLAI